jgi:DNA-binding response OmpR family regulator
MSISAVAVLFGLTSVQPRCQSGVGNLENFLAGPMEQHMKNNERQRAAQRRAVLGALLLTSTGALADTAVEVEPVVVNATRTGDEWARTALSASVVDAADSRGEQALNLLPTEYKLLEYLMRHAGQVITRMMIFEEVWGYHFDPGTNLIDVHIGRLRKKIDSPGQTPLIRTVRGSGYAIAEPV